MTANRALIVPAIIIVAVSIGLPCAGSSAALGQTPATGQPAITKRIGSIKAMNGSAITLTPDSGPEITVNVLPSARMLRLVPGDKDLKNATPLSIQDLQIGDTIRVRGLASDDAKSINALEVIVITRSAVAAVSEQMRQDWQKRGLGGIVRGVDASAGTVNISVSSFGGIKTIVVHAAKGTLIRRYAPDSVKFEDAKPSTLQEIHVGDQLRARGNRSADGGELAADEIVTGTFPYVEGTVKSVDARAGTLSVQDILSKKTVQVKITPDSQLHKIPAEMAQRFAMRLKSAMPPGTPGTAGGQVPKSAAVNGQATQAGSTPGGTNPGGGVGPGAMSGGMGGMRQGGAPDFQQFLSHIPSSTLAELNLQKGDAVVILATEGTPSSASTAITLLSGVEPILQAAPNGSQAMMLAPWNLGGAPNGDAGNP